MCSRKVSVTVFSYPLCFKRKLFHKSSGREEIIDEIDSSQTLEDLMSSYYDKISLIASFEDDLRWYQIILLDSQSRLVKLFKA